MGIGCEGAERDSVKEPDPGVHEAVCCIVHAAPRTELKGAPHPVD